MPHPGPDQLTLAALPAEPIEPELAAHLAICTICHAEVASLRHTVDLARANPTDPAANTGSPPHLWHAINSELDGDLAAPPRIARTRRRRLRAPAATAAAGLAGSFVQGDLRAPPDARRAAAQGPALHAGAGSPRHA